MIFEKLKKSFPKMRQNELLKSHSTFRVGGPADFFYEMSNIEELPQLVRIAEQNTIPYKVIGRGTNILFTDKGFRGLIIKNITSEVRVDLSRNSVDLSRDSVDEKDGYSIILADSGVLLSQIIRLSTEHNLTGLEPLYGLPGSIGGAVWGNAGVPNTEISSFLEFVMVFNAADGIRELAPGDFESRYRWSSLQKSRDLVMRVALRLEKMQPEKPAGKELMKQIDVIRRGKQPIGYSAGSFFKNPSKEKAAGYLIDQAGLKGSSVGGAEISTKHGNFFLNKGNATAADILKLGKLAQEKVKEKFGIELEMEVKIVGEQ